MAATKVQTHKKNDGIVLCGRQGYGPQGTRTNATTIPSKAIPLAIKKGYFFFSVAQCVWTDHIYLT